MPNTNGEAEPLDELIDLLADLPDAAERKRLRLSVGLSTHALARLVGVSQSTVMAWEVLERTPQRRHLRPYVEALRIMRRTEATKAAVAARKSSPPA